MLRIIFCLIFVLTGSVLARADFQLVTPAPQWVATHRGEAELDGLPITALLEETQDDLVSKDSGEVPVVPSLLPVVKRSFRLKFFVSHNPSIRTAYALLPGTYAINGALRFAYVSKLDVDLGVYFVVTPEADGKLNASYSRKSENGSLTDSFTLLPIPHIFTN